MYIRRPMCLFSVAFAVVLYLVVSAFPPHISENALHNNGKIMEITGKVSKKELKNGKIRLYLKKNNIYKGLIAELNPDEYPLDSLKMGSILAVKGKFRVYDKPENEGQFDMRRYYCIRGIEGRLTGAEVISQSEGYNPIREYLTVLRIQAEKVFATYMNESDAGIMEAIVLGDKNELEEDVKELYQNAGIAHVLSLSGLHMAAVGLFLLKSLKKTPLPGYVCSLLSLTLLLLYALLTGMAISTARALIMFGLAIIADILGRTYDMLSAASFSSVMVLLINPYYILDTAFLLSFGAIIGVGCVFPGFSMLFKKENDNYTENYNNGPAGYIIRMGSKIYDGIILSLSISFTTLPVVASAYFKISRYSFAANIIIIPLMGMLLLTGFVGLGVGMLQYIPLFSAFKSAGMVSAYSTLYILKISHVILYIYSCIAEKISQLYGNVMVIGAPEGKRVIIYYILLALVVLLGHFEAAWQHKLIYIDHVSLYNEKNNMEYYSKKNYKITISTLCKQKPGINQKKRRKTTTFTYRCLHDKKRFNICITLFSLVILMFSLCILTNRPKNDFEIRSLSVGQGDCNLIFGKDTPVIVVDGGSSDVKKVGKYRIIPAFLYNGVATIDYLFMTHLDDDHINGLMELLEDESGAIRVKRVIISEACSRDLEKEEILKADALIKAAKSANTQIYTMSAGDEIKDGDIKITCVWPVLGREYADENDKSLVLKVEKEGVELKSMFTGDISSEAEKEILKEAAEKEIINESFADLDIDYLKIAHHGSRFSTSEEFLQATTPKISVISSGAGNSYGHPHKETLMRLNDRDICYGNHIFRTDTDGEIIITVKNDRVICKTPYHK